MEIVDFGHFTVVNRDARILYYRNEEGQDWYELRRGLTHWETESGDFIDSVFGTWATVDPEGVIIHVEYNPSRIVPDDKTVLGIDADPEDIRKGMIWDGLQLLQPTPESLEKVGPPL